MTLAFGDLQGCRRPLQRLLDKIKPSEREPLWFCGDLVNRGPDSLGVLRQVYRMGPRARVVLGNHDLHLLANVAGIRSPRPGDTLAPILKAPDRDQLIHWLRTRPLAVREGDFLMVHAGLAPQWHIEQVRDLAREVESVLAGPDWQDFLKVMYGNQPDRWDDGLRGDDRLRCIINFLTRTRYLYRDDWRMDFRCTEPPHKAPAELIPWFDAPHRRSADSGVAIVFGHWSSLGLQLRPDLIALDTGCVWGGCLSAIRLENRQVFQQYCEERAG
ncbi:MAG: symmetrical bis(5'-nucleosyl)-tetraphosphatase [Lautropia sp.]|nr:symmetrical bis(5'-nucleosyl)-tetraphosphatase [Lautropia sp.]